MNLQSMLDRMGHSMTSGASHTARRSKFLRFLTVDSASFDNLMEYKLVNMPTGMSCTAWSNGARQHPVAPGPEEEG
jgi:hypothetical protein